MDMDMDMDSDDGGVAQVAPPEVRPAPGRPARFRWDFLKFASCDGAYRWFDYNEEKNIFAQELAHGKWYRRDVATNEFKDFDWKTQGAGQVNDPSAQQPRRAKEREDTVVYVKMDSTVPVTRDSYQQPVYAYNQKGQQLVPRKHNGEPYFPCDENRLPLFPVNLETKQQDFLYTEDGIPAVPLTDHGHAIVPLDLYGLPHFPLDPSGSIIWPVDEEGKPYPPVNYQGVPCVRYDEQGLPIVPFNDDFTQQLIMFDMNGTPVKLSDFKKLYTKEQADTWGGGRLPPQLFMPAVDEAQQAEMMHHETPDFKLPEMTPELAAALAHHGNRRIVGKFHLEYGFVHRQWGEEVERKRQEQERIWMEEQQRLFKEKQEEENRKKRLASVLQASRAKDPEAVALKLKGANETAQELKANILAKRARLKEEAEKKKEDAEKEVLAYFDDEGRGVERVAGPEEAYRASIKERREKLRGYNRRRFEREDRDKGREGGGEGDRERERSRERSKDRERPRDRDRSREKRDDGRRGGRDYVGGERRGRERHSSASDTERDRKKRSSKRRDDSPRDSSDDERAHRKRKKEKKEKREKKHKRHRSPSSSRSRSRS